VFPGSSDKYWDMILYQSFNVQDAGGVWVSLNDMETEGYWIDSRPWTDDLGAVQDESKNCAVFHEYCSKTHCEWDNILGWICTCVGWDWEWQAQKCASAASLPYACRSDKTGEWQLTAATGANWVDGFDNCRKLGGHWYFDAPISKSGNAALFKAAVVGDTWMNYTDAKQEGLWRHGRWEYWDTGEPNNTNGNENCAIAKGVWPPSYAGMKWNDVACSDQKRPIAFVRYNATDEDGLREWKVGGYVANWEDADAECKKYGYRFGVPYCPSEMQALVDAATRNDASQHGIWIRYTDRDEEGWWNDWWSGWEN
jgi:hypothetical protein